MKTTFTTAILIMFMTVAAVPCLAQQRGTVSFNYDANGNRISRTLSFRESKGRGVPDLQEASPMLASAADELAGLKLMLYPNPTDGQFAVGVTHAGEGMRLVAALYTPSGTLVSRKALSGDHIDFDLSSHSAGVYVLRIEAGGETRIWKVIKH